MAVSITKQSHFLSNHKFLNAEKIELKLNQIKKKKKIERTSKPSVPPVSLPKGAAYIAGLWFLPPH